MFSRFEMITDHLLYVRSVDIRALEDIRAGKCTLIWESTPGQLMERTIKGTADENMARLQAEETAMLVASEKLRARHQNGLPSMPVIRGRK